MLVTAGCDFHCMNRQDIAVSAAEDSLNLNSAGQDSVLLPPHVKPGAYVVCEGSGSFIKSVIMKQSPCDRRHSVFHCNREKLRHSGIRAVPRLPIRMIQHAPTGR